METQDRPAHITRIELPALLGIAAAACVLHLGLITLHGLRNNEFITLQVLRYDWWTLVEERFVRNHMPLYFLGLKAWVGLAGWSEASLRLPSALFGILWVAALWWTGRMMFNPQVALTAALLGAVHQQAVEMSHDARMYVHVMPFTLLALGCMWRWETTGRLRWAAALAVVLFLGLATHLLLITVLLSLLAATWLRPRRSTTTTTAALLLPLLALAPLVWRWSQVQYKVGVDPWQVPSLGRLLRNMLIVLFGDYEPMGDAGKDATRAVGYILATLTIAAVIAWRRSGRWHGEPVTAGRRRAWALLMWVFALPPVLSYLAAIKSNSALGASRYLAVSTAVVPLVMSAAWLGLARPWMRWAGLSAVLGLMGVQTAFHLANGDEGIRASMQFLRGREGPGRVAVACCASATRTAFSYYGVTMPTTILDREEEDPDLIRSTVRAALGDDGERLYLFRQRAERSPAQEVLRDTPWLQFRENERFGLCRITVLEVEHGPE